ncbi:Uridine kinase [Alternaria alternata]|nr:Uridine kinase [Alternaria alternata]
MSSAGRRTHYEPPWGNASIIGVAGSSGSGKTSLAMAIVASLNLPWVVILSMVRTSLAQWVTCSNQLRTTACRIRSTSP